MNSSLCAKQNADAQAQRRLHFSHKSLAKSGHCAETVYGRVDLAINCGPVSKFWGWDSGQLEKDGGPWPGGVRTAHSLSPLKMIPHFTLCSCIAPLLGGHPEAWRQLPEALMDHIPSPLAQRGSVALLELKPYCGMYSS